MQRLFAALRPALWPYRWWLLVALPLACWYAAPLWSVRVLPLHDLPNHLARITVLHYVDDPAWNLSQFYQRSLRLVPYLGHFYTVHLLTYLTRSVIVANLVFLTAYVVTTPLCGLVFARATRRSPWLALLLLPLAVSFYFQWGFISFCCGAMLMLPAMAALYRLLDTPSGRGAVVVGVWTALLYLFHIVPWGAFGLYAILLCIVDAVQRRWRGPIYAALAMAPSLVMLAVGTLQARQIGYIGKGRFEAEVDTPAKLVSRAAAMVEWFSGDSLDEWVTIGLIIVLVALVITDGGPRVDEGAVAEPWRRRMRVPVALVAFLAMAFATPFWVRRPFNWWMINQRFLFLAAIVAVFLPRGPIRGARLGLVAAAVALMALLPQEMIRHYRDFSRRAWPLIQLIKATPMGSNTLMLHSPYSNYIDPALSPHMTIWRELYNYPLVYRGGYDPYLYDDGYPVRRIASLPAPKVSRAAELDFNRMQAQFDPTTMMLGWDYFIVPEEESGVMPVDGAVRVRDAGSWTLYRNVTRTGAPSAVATPRPTD